MDVILHLQYFSKVGIKSVSDCPCGRDARVLKHNLVLNKKNIFEVDLQKENGSTVFETKL